MVLSVDEVRRIAELARLRLSAEEEELFSAQLGEVVAYFDQLSEAEVAAESVETLGEPREFPDEPAAADEDERELYLANAPERRGEFFEVPEVKAGDGDG